MALRLTATLRAQLARASEALLTPPEHGGLLAWRNDVRAAVGTLLRADTVALRLPAPLPPDPHEAVPPALDLAFRTAADPARGALVLGRVPGEGAYMAAVVTARPRHVAGLLWSRRLLHPRFPPGAETELLRLLYPAFKAGIAGCIETAQRQAVLRAVLDSLTGAAALLDGRGRTLHRNRALAELLAANSDADRLTAAADALVIELRRQSREGSGNPAATRTLEVQTGAGPYRLFGRLLDEDVSGPAGSILLVVEPRAPQLPPAARLRRQFGLSRREAEVALLLAQGRRNSAVAESLGISPHTARHHTEMVLAKLGSRSRAEVGPLLLRA